MSDDTTNQAPALSPEQKAELFRQTLSLESQIAALETQYSQHCEAIKNHMPPGPWKVAGRLVAVGKRGNRFFLKDYSPGAREEIAI